MKSTNYRAYLLRLWRDGENQPWRALLENPHTGEQRGFANLEQLFAYLELQTTRKYHEPDEKPIENIKNKKSHAKAQRRKGEQSWRQ